ncbi:MAG: alginate lyase family protein [Bacteroidales bacterium]|nr:alginate lyase family protein [Bacteroidales bacterium]
MRKVLILLSSLLLLAPALRAADHPNLLLTRRCVSEIRSVRGSLPLFDFSVNELLKEADAALERPLDVPVPRDGGGGPSHEQHKQNYYDMYHLGVAWQVSGEKRYAQKAREILLAYARLYPTLGYHPVVLSPVPGRLFWQTLNESVWLVHTAMAYDCLYDFLSSSDRKTLEKNLFRPMAAFIMDGTADNHANRETFNKMHNHGTWAVSAVGMIGLVMGDDELVRQALYGSEPGGGFLRQMDELFSPDGYFTEGAYYQRYALWPFVLFAQCLDHARPGLRVFERRDGILCKAVDTLLQLAYGGEFFHYNDALEKGYSAQELMYAVDIIYNVRPQEKQLLSIARDYQGRVLVSDAGFAVARDIAAGQAEPYVYRTRLLRDGRDGRDGALAVLRSREGSALTFKATSHGLSHGHYDKLTVAWYDGGHEVVSDYGAARFLNIEAKYKGHYTPENKSYAMTTVAHNTVVVDGRSHYDGKIKVSSQHAPRLVSFEGGDPAFQYVCAVDSTAAPGVRLQRWTALAEVPFLDRPLILDLFRTSSDSVHDYDLPLHYNGHMISLSLPYKRALDHMEALGTRNGYQHLWVEAQASGAEGSTAYTWLCGSRMYSYTACTSPQTEVLLLRTGAGDPNFNLRSEPALMLRERGRKTHLFASCLETHGRYDLRTEQAADMVRSCEGLEIVEDGPQRICVRYRFKGGHSVLLTAEVQNGKMNVQYQ